MSDWEFIGHPRKEMVQGAYRPYQRWVIDIKCQYCFVTRTVRRRPLEDMPPCLCRGRYRDISPGDEVGLWKILTYPARNTSVTQTYRIYHVDAQCLRCQHKQTLDCKNLKRHGNVKCKGCNEWAERMGLCDICFTNPREHSTNRCMQCALHKRVQLGRVSKWRKVSRADYALMMVA